MNVLPEGWIFTTIGQVCSINPKDKLDDGLDVGFMPMAGMPTKFLGRCEFEVKKWKDVKKGFTQFKDGDALFAKITPCFENGKATVVKSFPSGWGAGSTEYFVLRPTVDIVNPYILFALVKTKDFLITGATNMTGSVGHKRVPKDFVEGYSLPLPPFAEQKIIADKLDELLAQVDSIKTRLDTLPKIIKRFRQSVLAAAVSGKLTKAWRNENHLDFNDWTPTNIGSIASVSTGKTPSRTEHRYWDNADIPWLTSASTGNSYTYSAEQFVTDFAVKDCGLRIFNKGTLLLAMYGEGKTRGQVTELMFSATCNQACAAIIAIESKISRAYLKIRLLENYEETRKVAAGGAQPNLNLNKVREIPVLLPSLAEQTEIVRRVEQLFAYADQLEQQIKNAQARVNHLTQAILAKAFRGELTADWRAANPALISGENSAQALLARIKAEKNISPKTARQQTIFAD